MTTPREIIAEAKIDKFGRAGERAADAILEALTTAGYHILSDTDLAARDDAVLERAAAKLEATRSALGPIAATAVRALKGGKP